MIFQIVECNALPTLILMLRSEDAAVHYEAVRVTKPLIINARFCNNFQLFVRTCLMWHMPMKWIVYQVGVIGNLVHSSPNIKKEVLLAGALQPVIGLLRFILNSGP